MQRTNDLSRALEALHALDPGMGRESWVRVLTAAKVAGLTLAEVDAWSSTAENYKGAKDVASTWRSLDVNGGISERTLFGMARDAGWRDASRDRAPKPAAATKLTAPPLAPAATAPNEAPRPGMAVAEVWARCPPADASHGYIVAKGGSPEGLRVVPADDPMTNAGLPMAGALVVPVRNIEGEIVSVQFIASPEQAERWKAADRPSKLNLAKHPMSGFHIVGELTTGGAVYIVEGIGQAWACHQATGHAAAVTFGAGRTHAVAQELREHRPDLRLVLVPDVGKEAAAHAVARELGCAVAAMGSAEWAPNSDVNDYLRQWGPHALADLLNVPTAPTQRFQLLTADEVAALPPLEWLVKGVLPRKGVAAIFGPSGSGKSFLVLDKLAAVALGQEWFGLRVKSCPVVYVALEGAGGLAQRLKAYRQRKGPLPDSFRIIAGEPFRLLEPEDVAGLAAAVHAAGGEGGVVCIDTLAQSAPGANENAPEDMTRMVAASQELQRAVGGLVLLVHHTGKDATRGLRGHSSLHGALDAAIETERDGDRRAWRIAKSKDGEDGTVQPFRLLPVRVGTDEDGDPVSSCVIERIEPVADAMQRVQTPLGANQRVAWDVLGEVLRKAGDVRPEGAPESLPEGRPAVTLDAAIDAISGRLVVEAKHRRTRARESVQGLVTRGRLCHEGGFVWCA